MPVPLDLVQPVRIRRVGELASSGSIYPGIRTVRMPAPARAARVAVELTPHCRFDGGRRLATAYTGWLTGRRTSSQPFQNAGHTIRKGRPASRSAMLAHGPDEVPIVQDFEERLYDMTL